MAWSVEVGSDGKLETTPLVFNGVLYGTSTWSQVYAIDLRTGKVKWQWDPALVRGGFEAMGPRPCCGPVNRGVALYDGKVYVGLLDGRLVALNADTGAVVWSVQTTPPNSDYTITGAPRVIKGKVVIGQGGAEYGVRGFLGAYDAQTGKQAWKFYVIPGDPSKRFEDGARRWPPRPGTASGGSTAAAARRGTASPTIRSSISSTSAPATDRRGTRTIAAPAAATTSTWRRSSRSTPTPASTSGITRRRPAITGITTRRSR